MQKWDCVSCCNSSTSILQSIESFVEHIWWHWSSDWSRSYTWFWWSRFQSPKVSSVSWFPFQGSQFDAKGNMSNWWSADVRQAFTDRAQCVVDLYDSYQPLPGLHINGRLTEGENLAGKLQNVYILFCLLTFFFIRLGYNLSEIRWTDWKKRWIKIGLQSLQAVVSAVTGLFHRCRSEEILSWTDKRSTILHQLWTIMVHSCNRLCAFAAIFCCDNLQIIT